MVAVVRAGAAVVAVSRSKLARRFVIKPLARKLGLKAGRVAKGAAQEAVVVALFDKFIGGRIAILPTTKSASAALEKGLHEQKSTKGIAIVKRSQSALTTIKGAGLTALIPELRTAVAKQVAEGLGVPKWVIFVAEAALG